jgi:pyruvate dehydrogenase E2 component (dihydrolipoamide acetyltransferase)
VAGVATPETEATPGPRRESTEAEGGAPEPAPAPADGRLKASPVARRIAAESGIDLGAIAGSGPGGRIVKADVKAALAGAAPAPAAGTPVAPDQESQISLAAADTTVQPAPTAAPPTGLTARVEEASQMRKAIARRLVESIGPVPHFFLTTEIDMGRALALRAELNERWRDGKIGVNDVLLKATAEALNRHPEVNASWGGDSIVYHGSVDLGIAVAIDGGLITPVLRDAGRKGLRQISLEARALIERARTRKLVPEEYEGSTFSVSNLGMYEIDQFTAIINPPESGILAVGATVEKPVVVEGEVVVRKRMRVTMSCDHRVVDGATGAAFLGTFKAMLENPLEMIL